MRRAKAAILASSLLLASGIAFAGGAEDMDSLRAGFARPPRGSGPWVYWFWWDGVVARDEIARELEELAEAGFAGAEIRVVTFHGWGGAPLSHMDAASLERIDQRKIAYLSDEFVDILEHTCAKAEALGLRLALNLGQGWPPGGPWITDRHRSKHLTWSSREVSGPAAYIETDLADGDMVLAWALADSPEAKAVRPGSFVDLTERIERREPAGAGALRWDVPAGRWLAARFRATPGGICDKGDGPEADPASREAVRFHLEHLFGRLDPKLRRFYGTTLVDIASDSWEYERGGKRYWSPAILEAFPLIAGYDLRERMHALFDYGPEAGRVIEDFDAVERRLIHDNFFAGVTRFLRERGLRHRPQAYGRGLARDLLAAYALADIPEIEQGIILPEAPWAAHATGGPIVSAEAFTFLSGKPDPIRPRNGPWETTPALLRWHANHFYGQGINRIQMHSFSYSPPGIPLPGWRMYAEIHLNRNVPWWPYIGALTTWMARTQWLLQAGRPVADALVYPVRSNPEDGPFFSLGDRQPISAANAIDGANAYTLRSLGIRTASGEYTCGTICLIDDVKSVDEARSLLRIVESGARLATCARAGSWRKLLDDIRSVRWMPAEAQLVFQHRRVRDGDIYFIVNHGDPFAGEVSFPYDGLLAERWDADTGEIHPIGRSIERDGRTTVPMRLGHFESGFVTFRAGARPAVREVSVDTIDAPAIRIDGPWPISAPPRLAVSPAVSIDRTLDRLVSWRDIPELKFFAGTVTYAAEFTIPEGAIRPDLDWILDLGEVYELAAVRINGRDAGTAWVPPFKLRVARILTPGVNRLEVDVPNLLKNHLERSDEYRRPSGLLGPVRLLPERREGLR